MVGAAFSFWDEWVLYHKVTFDGVNRLIVVSPSTTSIDIKADIYSAWKEWVLLEDHSKFEPAIRGIGGDPVGTGVWAGDIYFLMNGWRIYVDHAVDFTGVIYTEEGTNPFVTPDTANVVRSTASNLALSYGMTPEQDVTIQTLQLQVLALYKLAGLLPGKPLTVTEGQRSVDDIIQTIVESPPGTITVTRT